MTDRFVWRELHWPRPLEETGPVAAIRAWAADQTSPILVVEARATTAGVHYFLGVSAASQASAERRLATSVPGIQISDPTVERRPVRAAGRLKLSTRHRALRTDPIEVIVRQILGALSHVGDGEQLVLQLILGPRRIPLAVLNNSPSSVVQPVYQNLWRGNGGTVDGEKRAALRAKVGDHGFAATVRLGVSAEEPKRRQSLLLGLYSALRVSEAPGLKARLRPEPASRLNSAASPWLWPLRINVTEAVALAAWPIGDDDLPGLPPLHPKQVAPAQLAVPGDRIVGAVLAPGVTGDLGYAVADSSRHSWILGPTGTGKSTLLQNLIVQDMRANRAVVVVEPNDLVTDLLSLIPADRTDDLVLLDATADSVLGVNPLQRHGRRPELVADGLLATFQALYGEDGLGPRSTDILANCLNVLARRDDASLVMLLPLLTNPGFRRSVTQSVIRDDPIAAAPFWAWFDSLSDDARSQITAPLSNKVRPLLRPQLRSVLAQRSPRINIRDVINGGKILLVPLQPGVIGPDSAKLLGALVLSEVWLALRERRSQPDHERQPVEIFVDEVQNFLALPTDLSDALATSRSLKGCWHLAHQYREQLSPAMRAAFEANARSRICFQLGASDARAMAAGQNVLTPEDFSALPAYHIYASLMRGNSLQPWASGTTMRPPEPTSDPAIVRARSQYLYGRPVGEIEADFADLVSGGATAGAGDTPPGRARRRPS